MIFKRYLGPAVALWIVAAGTAAGASSLDTAVSAVKAAEESYFTEGSTQSLRDLGRILEAEYRSSLKAETGLARLKRLDDGSLEKLFDAINLVAFFSETPDVVRDMKSVFSEIAARGMDTQERIGSFHHVCLLTRHFNEARALAKKYPSAALLAPPPIRKSIFLGRESRVFSISDDARSMRLKRLPWKKGARVIMFASPDCAPSKRAIADIEADPLLSAFFAKHALLIASPHELSVLPDIAAWNKAHKPLTIHVAYSSKDWSLFSGMGTPTFYFVKNGKVVSSFGGWSGSASERKDALLRGMKSIGLHPE